MLIYFKDFIFIFIGLFRTHSDDNLAKFVMKQDKDR